MTENDKSYQKAAVADRAPLRFLICPPVALLCADKLPSLLIANSVLIVLFFNRYIVI